MICELTLVLGFARRAVRNPVDIDARLSRAIVKEIGERLRASLEEDRELPTNFKMLIERFRQSRPDAAKAWTSIAGHAWFKICRLA